MAIVTIPLKTIIAFHMDAPGEPTPNGYAICNGQTITNPNNVDPASWLQHIVPGANGVYTTPNLLNVFLIGADPTKSPFQAGANVGAGNIDGPTGAPGPKFTGGSNQNILTEPQLPVHNHGNGSHSHSVTDPGHGHSITDPGHNHSHSDPGHVHTITDPGHTHPPGHPNLYFAETFAEFAILQAGGPYNNRINNYSNETGPSATGITVNGAATNISNVGNTTGVSAGSNTTGITIGSTTSFLSNSGSGLPHDNRPNYYAVVYLIKIRN